MEEITVRGRAKINLALDVLGKRADGYHEVRMIMQQVDLYDEITITKKRKGILLKSNCDYIPADEENIAYKAAQRMIDQYNIGQGMTIYIHKKIPVAAGLAGGSADAAAVLHGINKLWNIGATTEELMKIGAALGADVPFCVMGGTALAEGIGEKLTPIEGLEHAWVVLSKPNICVSTADVYKKLEMDKIQKRPAIDLMVDALKSNDLQTVAHNLCNVLETVTESMYPVVRDIKRKMCEYHALGSLMSGSGPTVFGLYKDYQKAKSAYENLSKVYKQTYVVNTFKGEDASWPVTD